MSFRLVPKSVTLNDLDLLGRGSWIPIKYNVTWLRPTSLPSGILIHVAVWPQQTWAELPYLLYTGIKFTGTILHVYENKSEV